VVEKAEELEQLGVYFITGEINEEMITPICKDILLKKFDREKFKRNKLTFVINSNGGELESTFSLLEIMKYSGFEIETVGIGVVFSSALLILMSGTPGKRKVSKDTTLMSHAYSWGWESGSYNELFERRKIEDFVYERYEGIYKKCTKLSIEKIRKELLGSTDCWLTPLEAKKFGIIDAIIAN